MSLKEQFKTHVVENQPHPFPAYNAWNSDTPLRDAVEQNGGAWAKDHLTAHGALAGDKLVELGELANRHKPTLQSFDRYGNRIDHVEFHPAYHETMKIAMQSQVHSFSWSNPDQPGAHVVRAALMYLNSQPEAGTACPLTMTHAAIPTLLQEATLGNLWIPKILSTEYDPRTLPFEQKTSCTIGMGMTEKQGGSDVRTNNTRAYMQPNGSYELVGHKFFFSAPMSDAHLVLAKTEDKLSCFLVPRILPDGKLNSVRIQRLKDKLGDWSNASSEVEFVGATAHRVGAEGRGIPTILKMVALTRLDCMVGSAALMRQALVQAMHHTKHRRAFGHLLIDQALMRNVLADLALESEAAVALAMRIAKAVDESARNPRESALARVTTAIGKYWVCKRTPGFVNEAQECLGGIGYVEENILPRLYRQAPLNSIWEGSGNVQCLDVLRAFAKEPETCEALLTELQQAKGFHSLYDAQLTVLSRVLSDTETFEPQSRWIVERMAILLQASLLARHGDPLIAEAFCRGRLSETRGTTYGTLDKQTTFSKILERALPII